MRGKVIIHPTCFLCDCCQEIRPKAGMEVFQENETTFSKFCSDCITDIDENVSLFEYEDEQAISEGDS